MDHYEDIQRLLNEVFKERHIDFSRYREPLIRRRVATRLRATRCRSYREYIDYLGGRRDEMDALLDALTINVTRFYRDPKVFEAIKRTVIPRLFAAEDARKQDRMRIWSCGCSGGEEATTILILMMEYFREKKAAIKASRISIYGTDIDKISIQKARAGVYEEDEFKDLPAGLKAQYFAKTGNGRYARAKELNARLFFSEQDVIRSAPVKNADLILCRNLFIYFKRELQAQCLDILCGALNKGGFLVLGLTESLWGAAAGRFFEFDRGNRIYRKM